MFWPHAHASHDPTSRSMVLQKRPRGCRRNDLLEETVSSIELPQSSLATTWIKSRVQATAGERRRRRATIRVIRLTAAREAAQQRRVAYDAIRKRRGAVRFCSKSVTHTAKTRRRPCWRSVSVLISHADGVSWRAGYMEAQSCGDRRGTWRRSNPAENLLTFCRER